MPDFERDSRAEKMARMKEIFEALKQSSGESRQESRRNPDQWLESRLLSLPERVKSEILSYRDELAGAGVSDPEKLSALVDKKIDAFEQTYEDNRFTVGENERMIRGEFAKEKVIETVRGLLDSKSSVEDLKKVARLSFDANGLKAVNDLSGSHQKGTEYLKRIADALHQPNSEFRRFLADNGVKEVLDTTDGGDEYGAILTSDREITQDVINKAAALFEKQVSEIDVSDLVDFTDRTVQLRYLGVSEQEFSLKKPEEQQAILDRARKEIPPDFKMSASISGSGANLFDGMIDAIDNESRPLQAGDDREAAAKKMMGGLWDASDKAATANKTSYKESLRAAEASPEEKFFSKVLARTTESRMLESKVDEMALKLRKMEAFEKDMEALERQMEEGIITPKAYLEIKRAKKRELEAGA